MTKFLLRRILQSILGVLLLLLITFAMTRITGDPTNFYLPKAASEQARLDYAEANGFNDPFLVQLGSYLSNVVRGDFGDSFFHHRPAMDLALEAFPVTLMLSALALAITVPLAVLLGSLAAMKPGGIVDRIVSIITVLSSSVPQFWIAILIIFVVAVKWGLLPTSGMGTPAHWVIPVVILAIAPLGILTQVLRSSMVDNLNAAYTKTAAAKGAGLPRIVVIHALRNSLIPLLTVGGFVTTGMVNGAVVVESVFGFPGIGYYLIDSILMRDFSVTIACIFLTAVTVFAMNVLIDLLYSWCDPRVELK